MRMTLTNPPRTSNANPTPSFPRRRESIPSISPVTTKEPAQLSFRVVVATLMKHSKRTSTTPVIPNVGERSEESKVLSNIGQVCIRNCLNYDSSLYCTIEPETPLCMI